MDFDLSSGIYVVAVSGGVDSMALLHQLHSRLLIDRKASDGNIESGMVLIVAHFDHGIRPDSVEDRRFVGEVAKSYGLPFVFDAGELGSDASEATARKARYDFLEKVMKSSSADGLITAHHQDDMLETAIINILRGTGRKGLTSLKSSHKLIRPLLTMPKADIIKYAKLNNVEWREDSTNLETKYLRNYVRRQIIVKFSEDDKKKFISHIDDLKLVNNEIDENLRDHLDIHPSSDKLDRHWFIMLPHIVAREVMVGWLRSHQVENIDKQQVERLLHAAKTLQVGKKISVDKQRYININKEYLALDKHER